MTRRVRPCGDPSSTNRQIRWSNLATLAAFFGLLVVDGLGILNLDQAVMLALLGKVALGYGAVSWRRVQEQKVSGMRAENGE